MDRPQENSAKTYLKLNPSAVQMFGSVFIKASQSLRTDQQLTGAGGGGACYSPGGIDTGMLPLLK